MNKIIKAAMAFNVAALFRALRYGPRDAARRLTQAYDEIDPFGRPCIKPSDETLERLQAIPMLEITEVVRKLPIVRIDSRHRYTDGALSQIELMALLALMDDWKPESILEIGTFNGATTAVMALNAPLAVVHTVDLPLDYNPAMDTAGMPKDDFHLIRQRQVGTAYRSVPEIENIVQHFADSAKWDFAPVKGASFFFIDGAHTYEYARNDTEKCLSIAAPKSRFVVHDCDERHDDVVRYIHELLQQGTLVYRIKNTSLACFDRVA